MSREGWGGRGGGLPTAYLGSLLARPSEYLVKPSMNPGLFLVFLSF